MLERKGVKLGVMVTSRTYIYGTFDAIVLPTLNTYGNPQY